MTPFEFNFLNISNVSEMQNVRMFFQSNFDYNHRGDHKKFTLKKSPFRFLNISFFAGWTLNVIYITIYLNTVYRLSE